MNYISSIGQDTMKPESLVYFPSTLAKTLHLSRRYFCLEVVIHCPNFGQQKSCRCEVGHTPGKQPDTVHPVNQPTPSQLPQVILKK